MEEENKMRSLGQEGERIESSTGKRRLEKSERVARPSKRKKEGKGDEGMIMRMRERKWTIRKEEGRECFMRARDNTGAGRQSTHRRGNVPMKSKQIRSYSLAYTRGNNCNVL